MIDILNEKIQITKETLLDIQEILLKPDVLSEDRHEADDQYAAITEQVNELADVFDDVVGIVRDM